MNDSLTFTATIGADHAAHFKAALANAKHVVTQPAGCDAIEAVQVGTVGGELVLTSTDRFAVWRHNIAADIAVADHDHGIDTGYALVARDVVDLAKTITASDLGGPITAEFTDDGLTVTVCTGRTITARRATGTFPAIGRLFAKAAKDYRDFCENGGPAGAFDPKRIKKFDIKFRGSRDIYFVAGARSRARVHR